jgi:hypothetical protein
MRDQKKSKNTRQTVELCENQENICLNTHEEEKAFGLKKIPHYTPHH